MDRFVKYEKNPILGGKELGTCFDVYVTRENGRYRMDFSWRPEKSVAVVFSDDGINWGKPQITLTPDPTSGWGDDINRNCVIKVGDKYKMWYTGQAGGYSAIGYAESFDGINFHRMQDKPVLTRERDWEGLSVMNPCVLYENGVYKMWYAAGETFEPNVLAYAESDDGINWEKHGLEPIFTSYPENDYEKDRVGGCQVLHTDIRISIPPISVWQEVIMESTVGKGPISIRSAFLQKAAGITIPAINRRHCGCRKRIPGRYGTTVGTVMMKQ